MNKITSHPSPGRHRRRCTVCRHPKRQLIEQAFLHWRSAEELAGEFNLRDCAAIYRHAHALGLFERRRLDLRTSSEKLLEFAQCARPRARDILDALRVLTCITPDGQWTEPPKRVIVTHEVVHCDAGNGAPPKDARVLPASVPGRRPEVARGRTNQCPPANEADPIQPVVQTFPEAVSTPHNPGNTSIPLGVEGLYLNTSTGLPVQKRRKSNATARTEKRRARQVATAQRVLAGNLSQAREFIKRLKAQGVTALIANHPNTVAVNHLAENKSDKNS